MSKLEKQIAIAALDGWETDTTEHGTSWWKYGWAHWVGDVPDYWHDLNACMGIIRNLSRENAIKYAANLQEITNNHCVGVVPDYHRDLFSLAKLLSASAEEHCEALLKTFNYKE